MKIMFAVVYHVLDQTLVLVCIQNIMLDSYPNPIQGSQLRSFLNEKLEIKLAMNRI